MCFPSRHHGSSKDVKLDKVRWVRLNFSSFFVSSCFMFLFFYHYRHIFLLTLYQIIVDKSLKISLKQAFVKKGYTVWINLTSNNHHKWVECIAVPGIVNTANVHRKDNAGVWWWNGTMDGKPLEIIGWKYEVFILFPVYNACCCYCDNMTDSENKSQGTRLRNESLYLMV